MPAALHQPGQSAGLGDAAADAPTGSAAAHCAAVQQSLLALNLYSSPWQSSLHDLLPGRGQPGKIPGFSVN